jgi:CRP-like cAMP-binding protein
MTNEAIDPIQLQNFWPLGGLKQASVAALARKASREVIPKGRDLFHAGQSDKRTFYLVRGEVELRKGDSAVAVIRAGTVEARNPLAPGQPRRLSAHTLSEIECLSIDSDLLDVITTWDQTGIYEVKELNADSLVTSEDWMTTLLQTKALHRIPASNLQAIFMRMRHVKYRAGDVVIKQGDEGDYFYAISTGSCAVTREVPITQKSIKLAVLGPGDTFGEEALISDAKRSATVTMVTDGSLACLAKDDFNTLLNEPMLERIDFGAASQLVISGKARWLDVRLPPEFETEHLPGAINVPLCFLRLKLAQLDLKLQYIVVCDTGRRSSASAFILKERGFEVAVLKGGLMAAKLAPSS